MTFLLLAAALAAAAEPADLPRARSQGWRAAPASLLRFDAAGELADELGLGSWTEPLGGERYRRRTARGGVSADGRFAWRWEKEETLRRGRVDTVLLSSRTLEYLGTEGQVLWTAPLADAPEGLPPLFQSADGERALVLERTTETWSAGAVDFTGARALTLALGERVAYAALTPSGRYAQLDWSRRDGPLLHTFLDLGTGERADIPAAETELGKAELGDDGVARSGGRVLHRFGAAPGGSP